MAVPTISDPDWTALQDEAVEHLRALVRIGSINPKEEGAQQNGGGATEHTAAEYLRTVLDEGGIASEILEKEPGRGNLIARLSGDGTARPVLLLGHLDVAGVDPKGWQTCKKDGRAIDPAKGVTCECAEAGRGLGPFDALVCNGRLWGRGVADMKDLVVMHLMALLAARRHGIALKRDLILAGVADEERGSAMGIKWLVAEHWDRIDAEFAFNEGFMGSPVLGADQETAVWAGLEAADKRIMLATVTARGAPGHAAAQHADNPVYTLADALVRLRDKPRPMVLNPVTDRWIQAMRARFNVDPRRLDQPWVQAMLHDTLVPVAFGGAKDVEISAAEASVTFNCRLLPTTDVGEFQDWFRAVAGHAVTVTFRFVPGPAPSASPLANELVDAYRAAVERHLGAHVPLFMTQGIGTTDSAVLRSKGVAAYGIRPMIDPMNEHAHGDNESIAIGGFRAGLRMYVEAVLDLAT